MSEKLFKAGELKFIEELSSSGLCRVTLVENSADGKRYVKREYSEDKSALFERLRETSCDSFPKTFVIMQKDGKTVTVDEYIEGETLLYLLENDKFTKKDISRLAVWLVYAVGILHKNGIVHGDIKPANIIICPDGSLKLIDFGVSKLYGVSGEKDYFGTLGYAAPEQFTADDIDFRTDIYSLGVTLQRAAEITGYKGYIKKIWEKCINCNPEQRFQSVPDILREMVRHNRMKIVVTVALSAVLIVLLALVVILL